MLVALLSPVASAAPKRGSVSPAPLKMSRGKVYTPAEKKAKQRSRKPAKAVRGPTAALSPDPERLREEKAQAARRVARKQRSVRGRAAQSSLRPTPRTALFAGLAGEGLSAGNGTPPDSTGTIGPNRYLELVNSQIGVYNRTAGLPLLQSQDAATFIGFPFDNVFDPQARFDPSYGVGGRWIQLWDDIDAFTGEPFLALSISKSPDPALSNWCTFFLQFDPNEFEDYPKLGANASHLIIGTNVFDNTSTGFITSRIWSVPKPTINSSTTCSTVTFGAINVLGTAANPLDVVGGPGIPAFTPEPSMPSDTTTTGYVLATDSPYFSNTAANAFMNVWRVSSTGAITEGGFASVSPYDFPPNAPQPGTTNTLDTLDTRLLMATGRADPGAGGAHGAWAAHAIAGAGGRAAVRWYEVLPNNCTGGTACPAGTIRQEDTISHGVGLHLFNPGIAPTRQGNAAAINYSSSSSSVRPQIRARTRRAATPLGVMSGEMLFNTSTDVMVDFSCGGSASSPCRWGDYPGASTDLAADVVWMTNMLAGARSGSNPVWRTRNLAVSPSTSTVSKSGSTITFATQPDLNNNVTVTLQSGFYHFKELVVTAANVGGCVDVSVQEVRCSASGVTQINLSLADRNDTLTYTTPGTVPMNVNMGDGNDTVNTTNGHADTVDCGTGTDTATTDGVDSVTNCSP